MYNKATIDNILSKNLPDVYVSCKPTFITNISGNVIGKFTTIRIKGKSFGKFDLGLIQYHDSEAVVTDGGYFTHQVWQDAQPTAKIVRMYNLNYGLDLTYHGNLIDHVVNNNLAQVVSEFYIMMDSIFSVDKSSK